MNSARRTIRAAVFLATAAATLLAPAAARAQGTSLQIPLQFDFLNPGAKSLALGGAFAGLADDATATFANPAGLTQLNASELSIEGRASYIRTPFLERGRVSGVPSNIGTDTIAGPVFGDSTASHVGPGFIAGVYAHPSHRWVIAGYRHELARVDQAFVSNGVFQKDPASVTSQRDAPQQGLRQVSITAYGVAGSYKLLPAVAIGGGISAYRFSMNSLFQRFDTDGFFGPSTGVLLAGGRATQNGDATAWAPTIGLMIGSADRRFGAVYRHGPSFPIATESASVGHRDGVFHIPDTLGFGASARLKPPLTLSIEVTRVWYSQLANDFVTDQARGANRGTGFHIDNGTEVHGGVQYAVPRWRRIPRFRAGAWFDPDHSVHYNPPGPALSGADQLFDELLSTALSKGSNRVHGTGGIGLTFSPHLEFNAGFDASSTTRVFSSSLIVR